MKHLSTTWAFVLLLAHALPFSAIGQSRDQAVSRFDRRMTPPSPQATQLGVFGSNPPDLNTGAVKTTVPLLDVQSRQLSLSVSLNYHYTGLQVTEVPSWVGLGWTLSAGGVITRTVQGLPDEWSTRGYIGGGWAQVQRLSAYSNGQFNVDYINPDPNWSSTSKDSYCTNITNGTYDSEPDAYNVSTPFYSGKLFLDPAGVITCSPYTDVRFAGNPGGGLWSATTGDGTVYEFSQGEGTRPMDPTNPNGITATTAWYLTRITSADGQDWIELQYGSSESPTAVTEAVTVTRDAFSGVPRTQTNCNTTLQSYLSMPSVTGSSWGYASSYVTSTWLTGITTPTTSVEFVSDAVREDIGTGDRPARRLMRVISRDARTQQVKTQYDFTYGYFTNGNNLAKEKRLQLQQVKQLGKPSYVFTYNAALAIPSRESFARDHWGYYNGRMNATLMPRLPPLYAAYTSPSGVSGNAGANRTADGRYAQIGALTQIQYPTGGTTQFTYEPNIVMVPCDYSDVAMNQFGGVPVNQPSQSFAAEAHGGPNFPMDPWEQEYAATHNAFATFIDPSFPTTPPPFNVDATPINATTGFRIENIIYGGYIDGQKDAQGHCIPPEGRVQTYLYQLAEDSFNLRRLCRVTYDIQLTNGACRTRINTASGDSLRGRHFPAGTYYIVSEVMSNYTRIRASIAFNIAFDVPVTTTGNTTGSPCMLPIQVGGIRLAKTRDWGGAGDTLTKTYWYRQPPAEGGASSGQLFFQPDYAYWRPCGEIVVSATDNGKFNWLDAGYHLGYGRVEVETAGRQGGTTVYYYANDREHGANCRSLVTKVEELTQTGALAKQTTNRYDYELIASSPGFRLTKEYERINVFGGSADAPGAPTLGATYYWFASRLYYSYWPKLLSTTEQVFGTGAAAVGSTSVTTGYTYLARGPQATTQPVRVAKQGANGQWQITHTRYAGQYGLPLNAAGGAITTGLSGAPAFGLATLVNKHMVSVPVEHQQWIRTGADSAVVGGDVTHFTGLRPARIFALTPTVPLLPSQFLSSQLQGTFQQDARYVERVAFPLYSSLGSLLQQRVAQAPTSSYLWGHAESKLIAEARNASYSQIAFTSFENDASGNWQYDTTRIVSTHFTGTQAYGLDGTPAGAVRRAGLPAGAYELLVWCHGSNIPQLTGVSSQPADLLATAGDWHQYRFRLSAAANATLTLTTQGSYIWIDELRLAPMGAQLVSYTHDPLVGITSQTDASGRTITYEYDAVGRLVRTRDEQGRLLSQQAYHYACPQ